MEPAIPRHIKDRLESTAMNTIQTMQEVVPKHTTRLRLSVPRVSASHSKVSTLRNELGRPARTQHMRKGVKKKVPALSSRRPPLLYGPKDDIALLRICVKLKDVIDWGKIASFWMMVRDTLELETGKSCSNKQVSRHVKILADNRRAEQREIEQKGKISKPRVSAGCRPLLDKWNAGGNRFDTVSTRTSTAPSFVEDEDDISLDEQRGQELETDSSALEAQKRSATDAWLDTSYETTSSERLKLGSPELISGTSKSSTESFGCWSLSGSSVTSESSIGDESEDEDKENDGVDEGG